MFLSSPSLSSPQTETKKLIEAYLYFLEVSFPEDNSTHSSQSYQTDRHRQCSTLNQIEIL